MAVLSTILTAVGVATSIAGTAAGIMGQQAQAKSQKKALDIQQRQNETEAARGRRQIYRDMLKAQAQSETAAASQGGLAGSSLQGGLAQAANTGLQSTRDLNENLATSTALYQNRRSQIGSGNTASLLKEVGSGLTSLGGSNFVKSIGSIWSNSN